MVKVLTTGSHGLELYGKRFVTREDAEPIVCRDGDGSLVVSVDLGWPVCERSRIAGLPALAWSMTRSHGSITSVSLTDDTLVAMIHIRGRR